MRALWIALTALPLVACATPSKLSINAAPMATPAPELSELERFVGTWEGSSEVVTGDVSALGEAWATRGEDGQAPNSFLAGADAQWVLGGMFVKTESWHDTGTGVVIHYVDFKTWDATQKAYKSWYFSDVGESGESWMTLDPDGTTFHVTSTARRADGTSSSGTGTIQFDGPDTMEWTWIEHGQDGKLEFRGTNTRL